VQAPVVREDSGLAMSSRNQYLTDLQKQDAALLYENLAKIKNQELTIEDAKVFLTTKGFQIEYLEQRWQRLFLAAKLGTVRLIDNIACNS
jgi:pantothenate synthetase